MSEKKKLITNIEEFLHKDAKRSKLKRTSITMKTSTYLKLKEYNINLSKFIETQLQVLFKQIENK